MRRQLHSGSACKQTISTARSGARSRYVLSVADADRAEIEVSKRRGQILRERIPGRCRSLQVADCWILSRLRYVFIAPIDLPA